MATKKSIELPPPGTAGKPLDPKADEELQAALAEVRDLILIKAGYYSDGGTISAAHIRSVYRDRQDFSPTRGERSLIDAQRVVSQALRENQVVEWVSYAMAIILFLCGLALLVFAVFRDDEATRLGALLAGSIIELLIIVPLRFAINCRRHNIALRMLGLILDRTEDPKTMASLLKSTFGSIVLDKP